MMRHTLSTIMSICFGTEEEWHAEIEGEYFPAQKAYTPRGEFAPIDPPEPEAFEIHNIWISPVDMKRFEKPRQGTVKVDNAGNWWLNLDIALLSRDQLDAIEREACTDAVDRVAYARAGERDD